MSRAEIFTNLTKGEQKALNSLRNDRTIIIKPADKGSAIVVWSREDYIKEAERQLADQSTYEISSLDAVKAVNEKINVVLRKMKAKGEVDKKHVNFWSYLNLDLEDSIYYQKYTKDHMMYQEDQSSLTILPPRRTYLLLLTII